MTLIWASERPIERTPKKFWVSSDTDVRGGLQLPSKPLENMLGLFLGIGFYGHHPDTTV